MAELVDARDSKSREGNLMGVQFPLPVPIRVTIQKTSMQLLWINIIEHAHDPVTLLSVCYQLLKQEGRIIITTPNIASYDHKIISLDLCGI